MNGQKHLIKVLRWGRQGTARPPTYSAHMAKDHAMAGILVLQEDKSQSAKF